MQPQVFGAPVGEHLTEQGLVVAAQVGARRADPQPPVPASYVVDQVAQRLRHRCAGSLREQVLDVGGRVARVERAPNRRRAEPVDGGAAGRLHVGEQRELAAELAVKGTRGDRGEVGLQQDMVERLRQQRFQQLDGQRRRVGGRPLISGLGGD